MSGISVFSFAFPEEVPSSSMHTDGSGEEIAIVVGSNPSSSRIEVVLSLGEKIEVKRPEDIKGSSDTERFVRKYFEDDPILAEVARCESTFRQYDKNGKVLRGKVNGYDVGVMQINEKYHLETSIKQGFDIYTLEGNLSYAKWLYDREGYVPWNASSPCWGKYRHLAYKN